MLGERHGMNGVSTDAEAHYELRILFGPMFGVDLLLPREDSIFFVVGPNSTESDELQGTETVVQDAAQFAKNMLFVPHHQSGINFRINFQTGEDDDECRFDVEWIDGGNSVVEGGRLNCVCQFAHIAFAVRLTGMPWSDAVLHFAAGPPAADHTALESHDGSARTAIADAMPTTWTKRRIGALGCVAVSLVALATCIVASMFADQAKLNQLETVFDNGAGKNRLVMKDGKVYVIASTESDEDWNKQIAQRFPLNQRPIVTSVGDLRSQSERVLDEHGVDYFTLLFDKVSEPELILVAHQGEDPDVAKKRIDDATTLLKPVLPFATGLHIREVSLDAVSAMASARLTRIPVTYSRIESGGYVTFFVTGYITDYALSAMSDLVKRFSHDWGHRKVRFGLGLKTTWLDGKSRRVGEDGYVLVDPDHWYFDNVIAGNKETNHEQK